MSCAIAIPPSATSFVRPILRGTFRGRRIVCLLGLHAWQLLYEPPHESGGRKGYRKGIFCIFCSAEHRVPPGGLRRGG